jgi:hypothetical protein
MKLIVLALILISSMSLYAQTNDITYQGSLKDGANPANGIYDFDFRLFDSLAGGIQSGPTLQVNDVTVTGGIFTVNLNFGSAFPGANRFLEIRVRNNGIGAYTLLGPRQAVASAPYAIRSLTTAALPNGTASYIQNQNAGPQAASNFSISGSGTASVFDATSQYNLTGWRVLSGNEPLDNLYVGIKSATSNPQGVGNTFLGPNTGINSIIGNYNTLVGHGAGFNNASGSGITLLGSITDVGGAGLSNATAIGAFARVDQSNSIVLGQINGINQGTADTKVGIGTTAPAERLHVVGNGRFTGNVSGAQYEIGGNRVLGISGTNSNVFVGVNAGSPSNTGTSNTFAGFNSGFANTSGLNNAFYGRGSGLSNTTGFGNAFFGMESGGNNNGNDNAFFGLAAGGANISGSNNAFFGARAGDSNGTGSNNTIIGSLADVGSSGLTFATALGAGAVANASNTIAMGRSGIDTVDFVGSSIKLSAVILAHAGTTHLCHNGGQLGDCVSSLRFKKDIRPFKPGLDLVNKLQPINFTWREGGMADFGLGAEDVAKAEPLLATYTPDGTVQGVKYDRVGVVLLNAVKEQQAQIDAQERKIADQRALIEQQDKAMKLQQEQIDALRAVVCSTNSAIGICKDKR